MIGLGLHKDLFLLFCKAKVYTITDVHELHVWMKEHFNNHPLFRELSPREYVSSEDFCLRRALSISSVLIS